MGGAVRPTRRGYIVAVCKVILTREAKSARIGEPLFIPPLGFSLLCVRKVSAWRPLREASSKCRVAHEPVDNSSAARMRIGSINPNAESIVTVCPISKNALAHAPLDVMPLAGDCTISCTTSLLLLRGFFILLQVFASIVR